MRLSNTRQYFERTLEFPVEQETVIQSVGNVIIDSPDGDSKCVADIVARTDESSFESSDELYLSLAGNLPESYVGRKYYDDRGDNPHEFEQVSF